MENEELGQKLMAAGAYLVEQGDNELGGKLGAAITAWTIEQDGGWQIEAVVGTLIDTLAYMIAEYAPTAENDKRMMLGAASAGLAMLGSDFIKYKMDETLAKQRMN